MENTMNAITLGLETGWNYEDNEGQMANAVALELTNNPSNDVVLDEMFGMIMERQWNSNEEESGERLNFLYKSNIILESFKGEINTVF